MVGDAVVAGAVVAGAVVAGVVVDDAAGTSLVVVDDSSLELGVLESATGARTVSSAP